MKHQNPVLLLLLLSILIAGYSQYAGAAALPTGASILNATTSGQPYNFPANRSDPRGTITTMLLNAVQQDPYWKAYVGNVTGKLSLDNAGGMTIYDWALATTGTSGKVYVSRASNILFTNVTCVTDTNITAEQAFNNMTATQVDNINSTFSHLSHGSFYVGTQFFNNNTCKSTATYRNDLPQTMDGTQLFQEVVLQDIQSNVLFMTTFNGNNSGYDNQQYNFQILVPESAVKTDPTPYYFYTELSG